MNTTVALPPQKVGTIDDLINALAHMGQMVREAAGTSQPLINEHGVLHQENHEFMTPEVWEALPAEYRELLDRIHGFCDTLLITTGGQRDFFNEKRLKSYGARLFVTESDSWGPLGMCLACTDFKTYYG